MASLTCEPTIALAEVLVGRVAAAGLRVQAEAVLGRREERVAVLARPAVAVAHVDHERGALERVPDRRPRRVRRVELDDVRRVVPGDGCRGACLRAVADRWRRPPDPTTKTTLGTALVADVLGDAANEAGANRPTAIRAAMMAALKRLTTEGTLRVGE